MTKNLVVIGAGMASGRMLEHLFEAAPGAFDVTLFNAEPRGNYNRLMLSPVLSGEKTYEQIVTHDQDWYQAQGVTCRFGESVTAIDRAGAGRPRQERRRSPMTRWSSPPARRPSSSRSPATGCPASSPIAIWKTPTR